MIAFHNHRNEEPTDWQSGFIQILPQIEKLLQHAFCYFQEQRRDECIQDGIVHCLLAHKRLFEQGRANSVTPGNLAWYAVLQVKSGREAGCRLNGREPLSRYAQLRQRIAVVSLSPRHSDEAEWVNVIVEDLRSSVADQVAARLDIRAWLATLPRRMRQIAKDLALGSSTSEVAQRYAVSAGRISQLRRELEASWAKFQQ